MGEGLARISRRTALVWIGGASGMAVVAACAPPTGARPAESASTMPRRGGAIVAGQQNDAPGFDPHRMTATPNAFPELYSALVRWQVQPDGSLKPAPDLATEWELKDDRAVFKLRQGVQFHDGSDWDAGVAKFNIERLKAPKSTAAAFVASVRSAEVVDRYTLRLNLTGPAGSLLSNLSQAADGRTYMISRAMAEKAGDRYGTSPDTTAGTGPMKLVEWVPGSHHVVQRTGNYWERGVDGQPLTYYDSLRVRFITNDTVRLVELRSGNVDVINAVAAKDVATAQREATIDLAENPYQVGAYQFAFSTKRGPFVNNLKLRQAVHYAINREAVASVLGQGSGSPMYYFLTKGYLGYDPNLPRYSFDPERARTLLQEAGFASGIDIKLSLINRAVDEQQAQVLKQMLGEIGIRVNLEVLERIAWTTKMATGQYEMGTFFTTMRPDPDSILAGRFETGEGKNYAGMSDAAMDQLLAKGRGSYDDNVRAGAYKDVQKQIYDTAWYGTIWFSKYFDAYRKPVRGRIPTQEPFWDLRQAWIEK